MEYRTGIKILEAVDIAQGEGFSLDQIIKLVHKAYKTLDDYKGTIDEYILINYHNEENER